MKIKSASVNLGERSIIRDGQYCATVQLEDEGVAVTGVEYGDDPQSAIHKALANCIAEFGKRLHDKLTIGVSVNF